jgi:hypothetical protein
MVDPYINPGLMLSGPAEGSVMDPALSDEEVARRLGVLVPKKIPPKSDQPPQPAGSASDLFDVISPSGFVQDPKDTVPSPQPTKATVPPFGGLSADQETQVHPKTGEIIPAETEETETERRFKLLEKLRPQQDYFKQAEGLYGPEPSPPQAIDQKTAILASLGPAIAGLVSGGGTRGFLGSAAMLSGLAAGETAGQRQYQKDLLARRQGIAQTGTHLASLGEGRFKDLLSAVHQERLDKANAEWRRVQARRYTDQTRVSEERLAFDKLKELDLQGYRQFEGRLGALRLQEMQHHNQIDEALAQGRLDLARTIQPQLIGVRREELNIHRQMVDIARQRALTGTRNDALKSIEGVQRLIGSISTELGTVGLGPEDQGMLRDQLGYYRQVLGELQQRANVAGTTTVEPTQPRLRVRDMKTFVDRWNQGGKKPVPRETWDKIDPTDQTALTKAGVTHE